MAGDMHFNADQNWGIGMGTDMFSVALHEAGHALGLGHSDLPGAVMYPYYRVNTALTPEDIAAVQGLYAAQDMASPAVVIPPLAISAAVSAIRHDQCIHQHPGDYFGRLRHNSGQLDDGPRTSPALPPGGAIWTAGPIPLSIGVNTITITAQDATGASASQAFTITRQSALSTPQLRHRESLQRNVHRHVLQLFQSPALRPMHPGLRASRGRVPAVPAGGIGNHSLEHGPDNASDRHKHADNHGLRAKRRDCESNVQITYPCPIHDTQYNSAGHHHTLARAHHSSTTASSIAFSGTARDTAG